MIVSAVKARLEPIQGKIFVSGCLVETSLNLPDTVGISVSKLNVLTGLKLPFT